MQISHVSDHVRIDYYLGFTVTVHTHTPIVVLMGFSHTFSYGFSGAIKIGFAYVYMWLCVCDNQSSKWHDTVNMPNLSRNFNLIVRFVVLFVSFCQYKFSTIQSIWFEIERKKNQNNSMMSYSFLRIFLNSSFLCSRHAHTELFLLNSVHSAIYWFV